MDLSVVIATRNRPASLATTLRCIAGQTGMDPVDWEVLVVINGSHEDTESVLRAAEPSLPLKWTREPQPGKSIALNRALGIARGELIAITDDDVVPDPGWLSALLVAARRWPDHALFGGTLDPLFPPGTPPWIRDHPNGDLWFSRFVRSQAEGPLPPYDLPYPPNLLLRARALHAVRFNEEVGPMPGEYPLGCELELMQRLIAAGERAVYVPSARLQHVVREEQTNEQWLLQRCFRAGRGLMRWYWRNSNPRRMPGRPLRLWRALVGGVIRHSLSLLQPSHLRFDRACELRVVLGQWYEHRRLASRKREV